MDTRAFCLSPSPVTPVAPALTLLPVHPNQTCLSHPSLRHEEETQTWLMDALSCDWLRGHVTQSEPMGLGCVTPVEDSLPAGVSDTRAEG